MQDRATSQPLRPGAWLLLLLVFAFLWFGNLDYRKLSGPDEGRYSEIPREMVASGDWLTPRLNGIKYFEKPPLQYWATAAAYMVFGEHQWTVRLWSALTGFICILVTFYLGAMLFGAPAGLYAALVLASSLGYAFIGNLATLDMGVTLFMTVTLAGLMLGLRNEASARDNRLWMHVAWAAMALAVLSKGLIGVVLPAGVLATHMLVERDFGLLRRLHLFTGGALFLLIAVPWFIAVSLANPGFFDFFFIHENFQRFLTKIHRRAEPWWFFGPILAVGMLPWFTLLADAAPRMWRRQAPPRQFDPRRFLLLWSLVIFVFFSLSGSKLPSYILPIFPALALLVGLRLTRIGPRALRWHLAGIAVLGVAVMAAATLAVRFASERTPAALIEAYVPWLLAGGALAATGAVYAFYQCQREKIAAALIAVSFAALAAEQLFMMGHDSLAPANSAYYIAERIKPYLRRDTPFYSVSTYEQTLPFYIKRTVTLVAFRDEMAYGLDQEPGLGLPSYGEFERVWRSRDHALALMPPQTFAEFEKAGLPMQVIAGDGRRVVVATPGATPSKTHLPSPPPG